MSINIEQELKIVGYEPLIGSEKGLPKYNTPITPRENFIRFARHRNPLWMPGPSDVVDLMPIFIPDIRARGLAIDTLPYNPLTDAGGKDMFGIEWVFVPEVNGSTVRPGSPAVEDIEEWRSVIKKPDIASWGWEEASERLKPYYSTTRANKLMMYTGLFERLISFMDFGNAAIAIVDEEQQPYVHEIMNFLCEVYEEEMEYLRKYLNIDIVNFHDDWGTQRAPIFSLDTCMEMIVPYLKRLAAKAHSLDMVFDFHSCGMNTDLVPAMIEAGVDMWNGQNLNDWDELSERYGEKLIYDIAMPKFTPQNYSSEDEFLDDAVNRWTHYLYERPAVLLNLARRYLPGTAEKFFERTYPISRKYFAEKYGEN